MKSEMGREGPLGGNQAQQNTSYFKPGEVTIFAMQTMASAIALAILISARLIVIMTFEIVKWVVLTQAVITFITWGPPINVLMS